MANCERIAEEEWGEPFYDLPQSTQDEISKRAMGCANDDLMDRADYLKKRRREDGEV